MSLRLFFFFNDTATTEIYTLSLHDALPICALATVLAGMEQEGLAHCDLSGPNLLLPMLAETATSRSQSPRSEEHTSELQSRQYLVCRLLLEKKKNAAAHNSSMPVSFNHTQS